MSRHACCAPTATAPLPDLTGATPTTRLPLSLVAQARGFANHHENAIFGSKEVGGIDTFPRVGTVFSTLTNQPVPVVSPSPSWSSPSCRCHRHRHVPHCLPLTFSRLNFMVLAWNLPVLEEGFRPCRFIFLAIVTIQYGTHFLRR